MKRIMLAAGVLLIIGACLPSNLIPTTAAQPTTNVSGLTQSVLPATPSETATLPPTPSLASVTDTFTPPTTSPSPAVSETATTSPIPNLTTTPATATEFTISPGAITATLAVSGTGAVSSTPEKLTYGTLPPEAQPFSKVTILNKSKRQAYISLQVTTENSGSTIIEYFVPGFVTFKAPVGYYLYVAWVGGNKMVGNFRLKKDDDLTIILYKDSVVIK